MFADHNGTLYEMLKASRLVDDAALKDLEAAHQSTGKSFAEVAIDSGLVSRDELLRSVAAYLGLEVVLPAPALIPPAVAGLLPARLAHRYGVVPMGKEGKLLRLACADPFNQRGFDDLAFTLECEVEPYVTDPEAVQALLAATYGEDTAESLEDILAEVAPAAGKSDENLSDQELAALAADAPIVRLVDLILEQAIRDKASDIHFEPYEDVFRIRYRIDGALYEMAPPPRSLAAPISSRLKVLADLNIAERRLPQDGRIKLTVAGRAVDLRVSTLPTQFGESVVLRVLDKTVVNLDLDQLGIPADVLEPIRTIAKRPNGIFIVTGPTGSGKTTTLYSALREVNDEETKILTAEDPVEYEIEGLVQTAINPAVGLTFAKALRSFLRQDPDKILVGEIRDLETAQIAVQASLTGHLVFSTLHTNDSAGAVTRLVDMGLEPYLISASLEAVLAQRLVRRVCRDCRRLYTPDADVLQSVNFPSRAAAGVHFAYGAGCSTCHRTGYQGRLGLFEMMLMKDRLRELIAARATTPELKRAALENGMRTLRDDGHRALADGLTTVEEVLKYT
jgi:type IV pilus assembly protein PilB